mgnify:CR=1 FL=1
MNSNCLFQRILTDWNCKRLLVVGELKTAAERTAAMEIARCMKWPCIVDVLSGMMSDATDPSCLVLNADLILSQSESVWSVLKPEVILQIGGRITSKTIMKFLRDCRIKDPDVEWISISSDSERDDPSHLITNKVTLSLAELQRCLQRSSKNHNADERFLRMWKFADHSVQSSLQQCMVSDRKSTRLNSSH